MNKKTYFEQLCELSYSCNAMNHGYVSVGALRRKRIGK